jgi:hypothetical protein
VTRNHSRHPRAVRSKPESRFLWRYMHAIFVQTYWSLRLRYWLWKERRILAKLHRVRVMASLPQRREPGEGLPPEESPLIAEVERGLRFQSLLSANAGSFIPAATGEPYSEVQELLREDTRKALAERETRLIAEYDALFVASVRIQFPSRASTTDSLPSFRKGSTRDSSTVNEPRT